MIGLVQKQTNCRRTFKKMNVQSQKKNEKDEKRNENVYTSKTPHNFLDFFFLVLFSILCTNRKNTVTHDTSVPI